MRPCSVLVASVVEVWVWRVVKPPLTELGVNNDGVNESDSMRIFMFGSVSFQQALMIDFARSCSFDIRFFFPVGVYRFCRFS